MTINLKRNFRKSEKNSRKAEADPFVALVLMATFCILLGIVLYMKVRFFD